MEGHFRVCQPQPKGSHRQSQGNAGKEAERRGEQAVIRNGTAVAGRVVQERGSREIEKASRSESRGQTSRAAGGRRVDERATEADGEGHARGPRLGPNEGTLDQNCRGSRWQVCQGMLRSLQRTLRQNQSCSEMSWPITNLTNNITF